MSTSNTALLLIDLQRDFLAPDGRLSIHQGQVAGLLEATEELVARARRAGDLVIHVVNAFPRWSIANLFRKFAAIEGSGGAEIDPRVPHPEGDESTVAKQTGDAFSEPELEALLRERGVERLVLAGVFAGGCVAATARGALSRGFAVEIAEDAVGDRSDAARVRAVRKLSGLGCSILDRRASQAQEAS